MWLNPYTLEIIAKAHIKDEIEYAARDHLASQGRTRKPTERSPQAGAVLGLTFLVLAAVMVASTFLPK